MAVPWGSLQAQRSRVLPQAPPNILGNLITQFDAGREVFNQNNSGDLALQAADAAERFRAGNAPNPGGSGAALGSLTNQPQPQQPRAPQPGEPGYNEADDPNITGWTSPPSFDPFAYLAERGPNANYSDVNPEFAGRLSQAIRDAEAATGGQAQIGPSGLGRTYEEQADLYRRYQAGEIGLAARPGNSRHEVGNAADIAPGPVLDWLHANAGQYGLEFLSGNAFAVDPVHIQMAGMEYANNGQTQPQQDPAQQAIASLAAPAPNSAGAQATAAYRTGTSPTPFTPQERNLVRQLFANPYTRELGMQLIQQRYAQPEPVDYGFINVGDGVVVRTNSATGEVQQAFAAPQAPAAAADTPPDWDLYLLAAAQHTSRGETPPTYDEWDLARKGRQGGIDPSATEQRYALLYQNAARELPIIEDTYASLSNLGDQAANLLPGLIGNFVASPDYQRALSAMTQIVQMQTYALTGAAATESEASRIARTLIPAIGDGPGVLADKYQRVHDAIDYMRQAAGAAIPPDLASPSGPPPTSGAPAAYPSVTTIEQYNALPAGTTYIDPEGNIRVKQ